MSEPVDEQRQDVRERGGVQRGAAHDRHQGQESGDHESGAELQNRATEARGEARRSERGRQEADRERQEAEARSARGQVEPALEVLGQQHQERREHRKEAEAHAQSDHKRPMMEQRQHEQRRPLPVRLPALVAHERDQQNGSAGERDPGPGRPARRFPANQRVEEQC